MQEKFPLKGTKGNKKEKYTFFIRSFMEIYLTAPCSRYPDFR